MRDISLHILDVVENGIAAGAGLIRVQISENREQSRLTVRIADDGRGMTEEELERARDPFYTTKPGKAVGLGLALFGQAARESGGSMTVSSQPGSGTEVHRSRTAAG